MRIGKQQVIWSEADALSGTEVTNPVDALVARSLRTGDRRKIMRTNVRMVKLNYILPDFFKTANNEVEGFWIPGDFQAAGIEVQTDPRNPWVAPAALGSQNAPFALSINQNGQQLNVNQLPNSDDKAMIFLPFGPKVGKKQYGLFADVILQGLSKTPSNSIENSEFGFRYSSLLPIGNGLQASFIYLYEFRDVRSETCYACSASVTGLPGSVAIGPGLFLTPGHFTHGRPRAGVPVAGSLSIVSTTDYRRNNFFGLTGTYYDKDLTDIVYRYDFLYQPDHAIAAPHDPTGTAWTEFTRFIVAADRPTYIPWISKQHTFLTAQFTETWLPDRPTDAQSIAVPGLPGVGKARELSNLAIPGGDQLADERTADGDQRIPVGHRRQRRLPELRQRLSILAQRAVRVERNLVPRPQRTLHRSVPAQPRAAVQRTRVHVHVRNLEVALDWNGRL